MGSAGRWLEEGCIDIGKVMDLEDFASGLGVISCCSEGRKGRFSYIGAELSEATVHCHTVSLEVLTE